MFYEYECNRHGIFEAQQSINDPPLSSCPSCIKEAFKEYHCEECNKHWSSSLAERQSLCINEFLCLNCGGGKISENSLKPKRLISLSSFSLKGGGWASEGYK